MWNEERRSKADRSVFVRVAHDARGEGAWADEEVQIDGSTVNGARTRQRARAQALCPEVSCVELRWSARGKMTIKLVVTLLLALGAR